MRHRELHNKPRTPASHRHANAWLQLIFTGAILIPCALAVRPGVHGAAASVRAALAARQTPVAARCDTAASARARLVIHVAACRFELFDACGRLRRSGPCSTGSDSTLLAPDGRRWTFRTPRGTRRVHHKSTRPVWYKPDWAFIEAGLPVPPDSAQSRFVRGMLGRHALDIGRGYLVHGSPYRIGIGTRSTHGCVRLLDGDLEVVYETLQIGDEVVLR